MTEVILEGGSIDPGAEVAPPSKCEVEVTGRYEVEEAPLWVESRASLIRHPAGNLGRPARLEGIEPDGRHGVLAILGVGDPLSIGRPGEVVQSPGPGLVDLHQTLGGHLHGSEAVLAVGPSNPLGISGPLDIVHQEGDELYTAMSRENIRKLEEMKDLLGKTELDVLEEIKDLIKKS